MPLPARAYLPDFLLAAGRVRVGEALSVVNGSVTAVGEPAIGCEWVRLRRTAILPGLVSAHSHAFQRALRGRAERRLGKNDFWGWRDAMYAAAARLDPEALFALARAAFHEMARAGITAVGEFHYLHRNPQGRPYADPNEMAKQIGRAARETGLRLALLRVAYARAGPGREPHPAQRRFIEGSLDEVLRNLDDLEAEMCGDERVTLGIAPHSLRACPADWIARLAEEARRRSLPFHIHLSEQPVEVETCLAEHGIRPALLLDRLGALWDATTAVHAIHLDGDEIAGLGRAGATVCACPTTERNLGDGIVAADRLLAAGARVAVGTDSNVQIDLLEDARELEYHLRLERRARSILDPASSRPERGPPERPEVEGRNGPEAADSLARRLYRIASAGGMASLGLPGGDLAPGDPADFIVVNLDDACIAGARAEDLVTAVVFAMNCSAVRDVYVAGEPIMLGGQPAPGRARHDEVVRGLEAAMAPLWGPS